jgi:beta-glucosidase
MAPRLIRRWLRSAGRETKLAVMKFPEGFQWGSATAAYQIEGAATEGGRGASIWDTFSAEPGNVLNGDTGMVACDHYHRYRDDVALMAQLNMSTYRFSFAWPRLLPSGTGSLNVEGVDFYDRLIDELLAAGIEPVPTLYHWDLPQVLQDQGGWPSRHLVDCFVDYAAAVTERFSDRVTRWCTFNEPWCTSMLGYSAGVHAPGVRDPQQAIAAAHHLLLAHGTAVPEMRRAGAQHVGIVLNLGPVRLVGDTNPEAEAARVRWDGIANRMFLDPLLTGSYPADLLVDLDPWFDVVQPGDAEIIATPIDWLGVNYYFDHLVEATDQPVRRSPFPRCDAVRPHIVDGPQTDMGWPITPSGFTELLVGLKRDYSALPPIWITENGCAYDDPFSADGEIHDARRISYLDQHLRAVHTAIESGVDIRGYFQWSLLDNFEWALGYDKRFGIVHVDFDTQIRTPRQSAHWYAAVAASNELAT